MNPHEPSAPSIAPRLEAEGVGVAIEAAHILEQIALRAGPGEFLGVIGPNGAGKSTLLKALSGLLRCEGSVRLEGRELRGLSPRAIAQVIAQVPQSTVMDFGFTSLEVVLMGRHPHLGPLRLEGPRDMEVARAAMAFTETEAFAGRSLHTLSGGERQRVLIARALAQEPRLLLLDEPTANLDLHHQLRVLDLVRVLVEEGLTAIAAIHDLGLAARYCDRLYLLKGGRLLAQGRPWEVLTPANLREAFGVKALVFTDPLTDRLAVTVLSHQVEGGHAPGGGRRVHVVGGGGQGARALYLLHEAGFRVTAAPLNEGDTDLSVARMLGIEAIAVSAFSPIDDASHRRHQTLVQGAEAVLLCDIKVGPGNVRNLEACAGARRLLLIEETPFRQRDFTGGRAAELYGPLRQRAQATTLTSLVRDVAGLIE